MLHPLAPKDERFVKEQNWIRSVVLVFFFLFYCVFCILFQIVVVANDLTVMIGSFAPPEDMLFKVWKGENSTI